MSDIFISYKREEQAEARALAEALEIAGWSVWWDPHLRAGEHFDDVIEREITQASCVIVLWSHRSVESQYVKDEAAYALKLEKLIPVAIDGASLPFRFQGLHTLFLFDWRGSQDDPVFQKLLVDVERFAGLPLAKSVHAAPANKEITQKDKTTKVAKVPEAGSAHDKIERYGKVYQTGDRVRILAGCGTIKPSDTGHVADVHAGKGQIGTVLDFQKKGVPSYLSTQDLHHYYDANAIEVALVRWDRQIWIECESNHSVTIDEFISGINVSYLEVIDKGESNESPA